MTDTAHLQSLQHRLTVKPRRWLERLGYVDMRQRRRGSVCRFKTPGAIRRVNGSFDSGWFL